MVCVRTNRPSCAKNPITHIALSCSMVRETSSRVHLRVWGWQGKGGSKVTCPPWICLVSTDFHPTVPLRFLSAGQFLTFPPNFMRTFPESETEKFETTWRISKCWYTSKLKLLTSFGGELVDTQLESVGSRNKVYLHSSIWENLPNFLHPFFGIIPFLIIVISVNTFSMDTFCDLWCM